MTKPKTRAPAKAGATLDTVRALALAIPGVEEGTSYGTVAFKVAGKLLARLRDNDEVLVVHAGEDARDLLIRGDPETFFITPHYEGYPWVLVRLAKVAPALLAELLEEAFRSVAPRKLLSGSAPSAGAKPAGKVVSVKGKAAHRGKRTGKVPSTPAEALERVRALSLALPETAEVEKHGRPCFAVRGKTFVMFLDNHHGDGRLALWCKAPPGAQSMLVESDPGRFFVPPYVGPQGWVGVRLEAGADWGAVEACIEESYRMMAPRSVLARLSGR